MLEGPSFRFSRDLPNHCEQESNWRNFEFSLMETSNFKRKSEDRENLGNSLKLLKFNKTGEMEFDFLNLSLSLVVSSSDNVDDCDRESSHLVDSSDNIDRVDHAREPSLVVDSSDNIDYDSGEPSLVVNSSDDIDCDGGELTLAVDRCDHIDRARERSLVVHPSVDYDGDAELSPDNIDHFDHVRETSLDVDPCDIIDYDGRELSIVVDPPDDIIGHDGEPSLVVDPSDYIDHSGEQSDTSSLISQIRKDNSIDCIARCSRSDYGSIAAVNRSFCSLIEGKELYKLRREIGMVEHWIYFSCNLLEWEVFDPIRLRWKHLPRMPPNDCFMHSDKESLAVGTELLVFGKEITSHLIYKYSLLTNSWSSGMEMNTPRCLFGSATLGEKAIVAGGCDIWGNIFSSAELYNSETGTWVTLPSMIKARKKCSAVFMDGKFYVVGGLGVENSNPLTCGEVYDLERRTWTEIPDMLPLSNAEPGAPEAYAMSEAPPLLTVVNNELYAADYARKEVRKYNKSSNSWAVVGSLPERAVSMHGWGLAFRGCGDKLIVLGGPRGLDGGYIEVNSWAPSESPQQWTLLGRKQSGGFVYNCAIMGC